MKRLLPLLAECPFLGQVSVFSVSVPESFLARRVGTASFTLPLGPGQQDKQNGYKTQWLLPEYFPLPHTAAVLGVTQTCKPLEICLSLF